MRGARIALGLAAVKGAAAALLADGITEWFWGASVTVGDYLYITGGEFYQTDSTQTNTVYYQGTTMTVDLTTSWTNQTVSATSVDTPDGMIYVRQPILFYDKQRNKVSRYGGWPYETTDFPSVLWSFTAGTTSPNFVNETSPSEDGLGVASQGPFASAYAYTNKTYYNFGGNVVVPNDLPNTIALSGLVSRDLVAQDWTNATANLPDQSRYRTMARMAVAPNFGKQGYLVMVGGESPPVEAATYETGSFMADMATISLYDIESATWFTQTATGDIPPPRSEFCAVGTPSSDGTSFELFVYGGATNSTFDLNHPDMDGYLSVYALSIPAFTWFKTNSKTTVRRSTHTCSIIGNRQMVSIGGRMPSSLQALGAEQDPWPSGLGVFDMTAFQWVDHYDASAGPYEPPQKVQNYYNQNYVEPKWSDATLASVFAFTPPPPNSTTGSNSPTGTGSSSGSTTTSGDNITESKKSSSNAGPIAGGVIGGLAVVGAIVGAWFFFRRRSRTRDRGVELPLTDSKDSSMFRNPDTEAGAVPMYEVDSQSRVEMEGSVGSPVTAQKNNFVAELPADEQWQQQQRLNPQRGPPAPFSKTR